jgi:hypothetical protein
MITERDIAVLCSLQRYYVLNRPQIQRLCFPHDEAGRITRRRLLALAQANFISRTQAVVHHPHAGSPGPVYFPSRRGSEFLAEHFDDERHLLTPVQCPQSHHLFHWLAVSDTHIAFDAAIKEQNAARLESWINEWDIVNPDETEPQKRYRLFTMVRESPRLVCAPDAGFLLAVGPHSKAFYLEQDRNTSGIKRVAAQKMSGYAAMADLQLHLKHFPQATVPQFTVLMVAPTNSRRDALRKEMRGKPGAELWRFVTVSDLACPSMLHDPVFHACDGEPTPLIRGSQQPVRESTAAVA